MHKVKLDFSKSFFNMFRWLSDLILDFIFPKYCVICGRVMPLAQRLCICRKCEPAVPDMVSVYVDEESTGCVEVVSALRYDGATREAMLKFKFKDIKYLGYTFAKALADAVKDRKFVSEEAVVTAIPLHVSRDREYNQAEVIARHMCNELGIAYSSDIIYKIKPIERLSGMEREDKEFFIKDAFMFNPLVNLTGKTVIIVDDVFTTGSTLRTISQIMRKHGAKRVYALTACYSKTQ